MVFNPPLAQWQTEDLGSSAWIDSPPQVLKIKECRLDTTITGKVEAAFQKKNEM